MFKQSQAEIEGFPGGASGKEPARRRCKKCINAFPGSGTLEEGMATHSSILSWRSSWTEEPGGLQSIRHDSIDLARMHAGRDEEAQCFRQKGIAGCVEGLEPLQRTGSNQGSWREGRGGGRVDKARKGGRTHFTGFVTES